MKYLIIGCLLFLGNIELLAQTHTIKGRAIAIPISFMYSVGIGYEYVFRNRFSAQILVNKYGYNWDNTDGGKGYTNLLHPEIRYYFKRKDEEDKGSFFLGGFLELANRHEFSSGDDFIDFNPDGTRDPYFSKSISNFISPGILLGHNIDFLESFYLEGYLGMKYNYIQVSKHYKDNGNTIIESESRKAEDVGVRVGINLGYRF